MNTCWTRFLMTPFRRRANHSNLLSSICRSDQDQTKQAPGTSCTLSFGPVFRG